MTTLEMVLSFVIGGLLLKEWLIARVEKDYYHAASQEGARRAQAMDKEIFLKCIENSQIIRREYIRSLRKERKERRERNDS